VYVTICLYLVRFLRYSASKNGVTLKLGVRSCKVNENGDVRWTIYNFLSVCHCKYSSILYRFWVIWRWIISWLWNLVYRSLKVFQTGTIRKSGYSFFFSFYTVTVALSCIISKIKWDVDRKSRFFHTPPGKYYTVTLKSRLEVTQGHWKWYHLKALVRFPIHIP